MPYALQAEEAKNAWALAGNAGTTPGTNYLGTSDNQALELKVNGARVLRLEPNASSPNLIGGYSGNWITSGVFGATIGGGGASASFNRVTDNYGTVGGGVNNQAGDNAGGTTDKTYATVGGGRANTASNTLATVAGGDGNTASGVWSTIAGGVVNVASGDRATVSGGYTNQATGGDATIGGGEGNSASNSYATVGGGQSNSASNTYATVGGGQSNSADNSIATVGGGVGNNASGYAATIGGGESNAASGERATVAGGRSNRAGAVYAAVGGGYSNDASGPYATITGGTTTPPPVAGRRRRGQANIASGDYGAVPGGASNKAAGAYSFAAGRQAKANNQGCFVWADATAADFTCATDNQFAVRATGGVNIQTGAAAVQVNGSTVWHAGNDGAASTLDADLLDGQHASAFVTSAHTHAPLTAGTGLSGGTYNGGAAATFAVTYGTTACTAVQGNQTAGITAGTGLTGGVTADALGDGFAATLNVVGGSGITANADNLLLGPLTANWEQTGAWDINLWNAGSELNILESAGATYYGAFDVGDLTANQTYTFGLGGTVWTSGNDGSASTLDADLLDGSHASAFATAGHLHDATYVNEGQAGSVTSAMLVDGASLAEILDDDGAGSTLDADLLDGVHASAFATAGHLHDATYVNEGQAGSVTSAMLVDGVSLAEILDDDGAGSTLDADLLDGVHAANLLEYTTVTTLTGSATLTASQAGLVLVDNAAAATITLPAASAATGLTFTVKRLSTNNVTVATAGGNIDANATEGLLSKWAYVTVISDGANWFIVARGS